MNEKEFAAPDFFDEIAGHYDEAILRCVPRYREMLDLMLDYVWVEKPLRILELGCGSGNLTEHLVERYPDANVTIVDASSEMLRATKKRFPKNRNLNPIESTFEQLFLPDKLFDLVVSSISIHHLKDSEKLKLFTKIARWLKPEGIFTFCDQFSGENDTIYKKHMSNWKQASLGLGASEEEWEDWMRHQDLHDHHSSLKTHFELLDSAGFGLVDCTRRYFLWTTILASNLQAN